MLQTTETDGKKKAMPSVPHRTQKLGMRVTDAERMVAHMQHIGHKNASHSKHTPASHVFHGLQYLDLANLDVLHCAQYITPPVISRAQIDAVHSVLKAAVSDSPESVRACAMLTECLDALVRTLPEMRTIQREMRAIYESLLDHDTAMAIHTQRFSADVAVSYNELHNWLQSGCTERMRLVTSAFKQGNLTTQEMQKQLARIATETRELMQQLVLHEAIECRTGGDADIKCEQQMVANYFSNTQDQISELKVTTVRMAQMMEAMQHVCVNVMPVLIHATQLFAVTQPDRITPALLATRAELCNATGVTEYKRMLQQLAKEQPRRAELCTNIVSLLRPTFQLTGRKLQIGSLNAAGGQTHTRQLWHDPLASMSVAAVSHTLLPGWQGAATNRFELLLQADTDNAQADRADYTSILDVGRNWRILLSNDKTREVVSLQNIRHVGTADRMRFAAQHDLSEWWVATMNDKYQDAIEEANEADGAVSAIPHNTTWLINLLQTHQSPSSTQPPLHEPVHRIKSTRNTQPRVLHDHADDVSDDVMAVAFHQLHDQLGKKDSRHISLHTFAAIAGFDVLDGYTSMAVSKLVPDLMETIERAAATSLQLPNDASAIPVVLRQLVEEVMFSSFSRDPLIVWHNACRRPIVCVETVPTRCLVQQRCSEQLNGMLHGIFADERMSMVTSLRNGMSERDVRSMWLQNRMNSM